jgi:tetratricopeptide (TPR) repeat protein
VLRCQRVSPGTKPPRQRLLANIALIIISLGAILLLVYHYSHPSSLPSGQLPRQVNAPSADTYRNSSNHPGTNQTAASGTDDQVAALVTDGNLLLSQRNFAEAAQKFEQAVALSPEQEDLHYNLAIALARLGKTEEAKKHYLEALRIFPEYSDAHNNLGNLLMAENKFSEAIERFQEAIKSMPENASFHNNLGTAYGRLGKVTDAITEFEQAVRYNPSYVEARVNLANAYLTAGRLDDAVTQLNEALRLKPDFKPANQALERVRQRQASSKTGK